jgi:GT2 family glycosyltransferase
MSPKILVSIVTYNSGSHIRTCLDSLQKQTRTDFETHVLDNASGDDTREILEDYRPFLNSISLSDTNLGFCAAHNRIIHSVPSDYVLVLNPDVILDARFLQLLAGEMERDPRAGSATGKLYRSNRLSLVSASLKPVAGETELDSTGFYFTRSQRHLDRGSGEKDTGRYDRKEYVFGASGAAAFYRRRMLEDIRNGREYFDESFFAYREDADLAWRARWTGWECLYVPEAVAFHERKVLPRRRSSLPPAINMHSFKNRFLLRIKNMDAATYARFFLPITARDAAALGYVLLRERASLRALPLLRRAFPGAWAQRRDLQRRRRISPREMRSWFSDRPVSKPAGV